MALKELSLTLGVLAGTAGVTNGGYNLYHNFVTVPDINVEFNTSLMNEIPLLVETVELEPVSNMAMRVEVTVKVYKNGTILVESGSHRQYIPFQLTGHKVALSGFFPAVFAGEKIIIDGVSYDLEVLKYIESAASVNKDRIKRVRIFANGDIETSLIDIRSNQVVETETSNRALTDEERVKIDTSSYKKKVFKVN